MRYEIYQEEPQGEKVVRWKLVSADGKILLEAVDKNGNRICGGDILCISSVGKIIRFSCVSTELGLHLDSKSRVIIDDSND